MNWVFNRIFSGILFTTMLTAPVLGQSHLQGLMMREEGGDRWLGEDKFLHFAVSAGISFGSFYIYREELHNNREGSYYFSGGFTISLGALKEYYDSRHPRRHTASWKDFAADALGVGAGLGLAYIAFD